MLNASFKTDMRHSVQICGSWLQEKACAYAYEFIDAYLYTYASFSIHLHSRNLYFYLFCRSLLQKRPIILRSLLIVATPYASLSTNMRHSAFTCIQDICIWTSHGTSWMRIKSFRTSVRHMRHSRQICASFSTNMQFEIAKECMRTWIWIHRIYVSLIRTGWPRLIGSPKLQIIFHKRATKYRSLLRKTIYKDKGSYESSPPCTVDGICIHDNRELHTNWWIHDMMSHGTNEWGIVMSTKWMSHGTYGWVMSHMDESWHIWMRHGTYAYMNESWHAWWRHCTD